MSSLQLPLKQFSSSKSFFPSIPSPRNRRTNHSLILSSQITRTLSPKALQTTLLKETEKVTKQQKVVSNFLLRYLSRKQTQQLKWNTANKCEETVAVREEKRMDPKFRRVYLKKIKGEKKDLVSRFVIGNQSMYSQEVTFLKYFKRFFNRSLTIER